MTHPDPTRRTFLKATTALATAQCLADRAGGAPAGEKLALAGGPAAVTYAKDKHRDASRWPRFGIEEEKAVLEVLRRPTYEANTALEQDWQKYYQAPYVKAHCSGTAAITAMFFALDLPLGSEILVPSYTFFATIVPMRLFGLVPGFVDIQPRTLNFDVEDAKRRLTRNTRAVFPVHWFGNPCAMDAITEFADKHGLIVLEDAAHAHGTSLKGKLLGNWSRMSIFSYQASKPMPAMEGGMGMYQRREDFERACTFGQIEMPDTFPASSPYKQYMGTGLGPKLRMNPLAAALARVQLAKLDQRTAAGLAQVRRLNDRLIQLPGLYEQQTLPDAKRLYYAYNVLFLDEAKAGVSRAAVVKALRAEGVSASAYTYRLQHKCALYHQEQWWHHKPAIPDLPGSEEANRTAIALPYFTTDVPELVEEYARAFEKVWAHRKEL